MTEPSDLPPLSHLQERLLVCLADGSFFDRAGSAARLLFETACPDVPAAHARAALAGLVTLGLVTRDRRGTRTVSVGLARPIDRIVPAGPEPDTADTDALRSVCENLATRLANAESERCRLAARVSELENLALAALDRLDRLDRRTTDDADVPRTLVDALEQFAADAAAVDVHPHAYRTARQHTFPRPAAVLTDLRRVDAAVADWRTDGGPLEQHVRRHGVASGRWCPGITGYTSTRYDAAYQLPDGRPLGPHLSWGNRPANGCRAYFAADGTDRTLALAHLGDPLPGRRIV